MYKKCVLSSIIVYSLIDNCLGVTKIKRMLNNDLNQWLIWISTFLGVLILDVRWGLYIGLGISIALILLKNTRFE